MSTPGVRDRCKTNVFATVSVKKKKMAPGDHDDAIVVAPHGARSRALVSVFLCEMA